MVVTSIEEQKNNKNRCSVFIDGKFEFGLLKTDIEYFKIQEGKELPVEKYDYIKNTLMYIKCQDRALHFLSYKKRTEQEVINKLKECEFEEEVIDKTIIFLKNYNYINDLDYAESFVRQTKKLKPKGTFEIKRKLRELGVLDSYIEEALETEGFNEIEGAIKLLEKKLKDNRLITMKEKKKLQDFLVRKGFSYDIIKETFKTLEVEVEKTEYY